VLSASSACSFLRWRA